MRRAAGSELPEDAIVVKQLGKISWYIAPVNMQNL
jgi:hypothetical protein